MALIKITFDSASVTSKQDADINHFLVSNQQGIFSWLLGKCEASTSNNYISFQSGYVQVYGRRVYVESGTKIAISLDGNAYGYVFIKFDLGSNNVTLEKRESSTSWPTLTQQDLINGGSIYELPLTRYTKTASSLTLDTSYDPPKIKNFSTTADEKDSRVKGEISSSYGPCYQASYTEKSGSSYIFKNITSTNASYGIGSAFVGGAMVLFPTSGTQGSSCVVTYYYSGSARTLSVSLRYAGLYLTASDGSEPKYVRVTR